MAKNYKRKGLLLELKRVKKEYNLVFNQMFSMFESKEYQKQKEKFQYLCNQERRLDRKEILLSKKLHLYVYDPCTKTDGQGKCNRCNQALNCLYKPFMIKKGVDCEKS